MYSNTDNHSTSSNIRFTPSKDSQFGSNSDVGTKPTGDARSTKDFKKVLKRTEKDKEEPEKKTKNVADDQPEEIVLNEDDTKNQEQPLSLFDLTRGKQSSPSAFATKEKVETPPPVESPSELFSKLTSKTPKKVIGDEFSSHMNEEIVDTKKDKFTTRFATEQPDLSYVNPLSLASQHASALAQDVKSAKATISATQMQDMIDQMVKSLKTIQESGKTDTMLTLKHPPVFSGVNVIISSYDSAKGEFNVAFENLTQAGKQILDMRANQESLRQALEQKGYAVHIVVTTTLIENRPIAENTAQASSDQRERGEQQEQQEKEGQEK